jgi:hypothetical protein
VRAPARALQRADAAARTLELDALGVVHDAIENGVGEGRLADDVVPAADRQLAWEQGRGAAAAILDDLEQVPALLGGHGFRPPNRQGSTDGSGTGYGSGAGSGHRRGANARSAKRRGSR